MEVIPKSKVVRVTNSKSCIAIEYGSRNQKINGAAIQLHGRYPDTGWAVNTSCTELVYITKGRINLLHKKGRKILNKGDLVILKPKEQFAWDGHGEFLTVCTPAWSPKQHKLAER